MSKQTTAWKGVALAMMGAAVAAGPLSAQGPQRQGIQIGPDEECPPATTEVRPGNCRGPDVPVPSILDYRPESTLIAAEIQQMPSATNNFLTLQRSRR